MLVSLKSGNLRVVIPSRGRSDILKSHYFFPYATLFVPESEKREYEKYGLEVVGCDDMIAVSGMGQVRNAILDVFKEHVIVMADDDIGKVTCIAKKQSYKITDTATILQIIENTAQCAVDLGTCCFGFSQMWDERKYIPCKPFSLNGWVAGVWGIVGRSVRFSDSAIVREDVDFCLRVLLKKRVLWQDNRFAFWGKRDRNKGGCSLLRTQDLLQRETEKMKAEWGKYVYFNQRGTQREKTTLRVPRQAEGMISGLPVK